MSDNQKTGAVLVVGGGIGGIQASLDLAEAGYKVYLLEEKPAIGGVMAQLDKTFPTNDCSMCIMAPKLVDTGRHPNIELLTYSKLEEVGGSAGNFKVRIRKRARSVNEALCTGCGTCCEKCPIKAPSEFDEGLGNRKAVFMLYPQAVPNVPVIDRAKCTYFAKGKCRFCETSCPAHAIDYEQQDEVLELHAGAIILAPGYDEFNPRAKGEYGYGRYRNVVTSIEFERILSPSGPFQGHLQRLSDGKQPKKVAFIQCVGSRDVAGNDYCSSVCCTQAVKEAMVAKEHAQDKLDTAVFFMDIRTYGKGFDEYYERAKKEYGVRFIACRVSEVMEAPGTQNLQIHYEDEQGKIKSEEFDLVVLSVGLVPKEGANELAARLGIELNAYGFCKTSELSPLETSKPGIFVCGAFAGPKDIPETVMQASGAAGKASGMLAASRGSLVTEKTYPPEADVAGQEPRVGIFVCHCGVNIGGYLDVPAVVEDARTLPGVVYAEHNLYTCSQDTQRRIVEKVKEHSLNRVVVASCTPRTHEPLFQETIREAGINRYLFEMANIREQCSWVHMGEREAATEKAKQLVRMAVGKVRLHQPLNEFTIQVKPRALVIGGGLSGMTAALSLAEQGFETCIVEREPEPGGNLRKLYSTLFSPDIQSHLRAVIEQVRQNKLITMHTGATLKDVSGYVGNFITIIGLPGGQELQYEHGVIIVATGGREYKPKEYLYGQDDRVVTQLELESILATGGSRIKDCHTIVMLQCVGSRNEERKYCSRVCCQQAVKNALKIKETNPEANIFVFHKDVRTYGFSEPFYEEARRKGILFIRYDDDKKPEVVKSDGRLSVQAADPILRQKLSISADLVVLSTAILPAENGELAKMLKVPLTQDGFFLEGHVKLRPVDFATDGIYLCGLCHSPKTVGESISQALGAAARAAIPLSKGCVQVMPIVPSVNEEQCTGCGLCVFLCQFHAMELKLKEGGRKAEASAALCKGCGVCGASCSQQAITIPHFATEELVAQIDAFAGVP
ncbi:MAG: CoB--CoM heterodisulfide reductase iron-sulfur subunit A family protein [Chloroflexota bacterium]